MCFYAKNAKICQKVKITPQLLILPQQNPIRPWANQGAAGCCKKKLKYNMNLPLTIFWEMERPQN